MSLLDRYVLSAAKHGGHCCGILHLHSFPLFGNDTVSLTERTAWVQRRVTSAVAAEYQCTDSECDCDQDDPWKCGIEVVLNDSQQPQWKEALEIVGFKEVFSFHNSNSGNRCYVYFLETAVSW